MRNQAEYESSPDEAAFRAQREAERAAAEELRRRLAHEGADATEVDAIMRGVGSYSTPDEAADLLSRHRQEQHERAVARRQSIRSALARGGVPEIHLRHVYDVEPEPTHALEATRAWLAGDRPMLWLIGPVGPGKSGAAAAALAALASATTTRRGGTAAGSWISAASVTAIAGLNAEAQARWALLTAAPALVVDDLGTEHADASGWATGAIVRLLCERYDGGRPTIVTGNLRPADIAGRYGERLADRLRESATIVVCRGPSLRSRES